MKQMMSTETYTAQTALDNRAASVGNAHAQDLQQCLEVNAICMPSSFIDRL